VAQPAFACFEPQRTTYSAVNAYLCMYASLLNYFTDRALEGGTREEYLERLRVRLAEWGFERVDYLSDAGTDVHCVVASNREYVLVSFRGTEQSRVMNWLANVRAAQVGGPHWKKGKVHRGFANALNSILDDVRAKVSLHAQVNGVWKKPVWLTGHSLGGALAVLAAFRLKQEKHGVQGIYTFGQPAVGGEEFIEQITTELALPYFRVVNHQDLIPKTPTGNLLGAKYAHGGTLCFITRDRELLVKPTGPTLSANPNPFRLGDLVKLGGWMAGHDPNHYLWLMYDNLPTDMLYRLPQPPAFAD
jgi:pimeloyl-ACP methyl ester carboxylesterase